LATILARAPRFAPAALAVGLLLALGGCGTATKDELEGAIGAGSTGPDVNTATVQTVSLTDGVGRPVGTLDYDGSYFTPVYTGAEGEALQFAFANQTDLILFSATRIVGRPDTPCRFSGALLARDENYEIQASGERTNDQGLKVYQVSLEQGPLRRNFYCATLRDNLGAELEVAAATPEGQQSIQIHYVLNTLQPAPDP
jgi:hypothetical protein